MRGDERLSSGYWILGVLIIAGAIYSWNRVHPFGQENLPPPSPGPAAVDASEAITPGTTETSSQVSVETPSTTTASTTETSAPEPAPQPPAPADDTPVTINYANLVEDKTYWPKVLHVKIDTLFPAMVEDKQVGTVTASAGAEVDLIKVLGEKSLRIGFGNSEATVDADTTDFEEIVYQKLLAARKK